MTAQVKLAENAVAPAYEAGYANIYAMADGNLYAILSDGTTVNLATQTSIASPEVLAFAAAQG